MDKLNYVSTVQSSPRFCLNNVTRVRFKRIKEFTDPDFQESLFWGDPQRLAFIDDLFKNHGNKFPEGAFLPSEPYVCRRPVGFDCSKKYEPYPHLSLTTLNINVI